jgi:hypothetical protein
MGATGVLAVFLSMGRKTKFPSNEKSAVNKKPPKVPKRSRLDEMLKVIEEYVAPQREFLKALRKRFFH